MLVSCIVLCNSLGNSEVSIALVKVGLLFLLALDMVQQVQANGLNASYLDMSSLIYGLIMAMFALF